MFRTYPQAWLALLLLVLLRTTTSVFQFTYSVIPGITGQFFNVSLTAVNWLLNIQGMIYVIVSFFTGWIFERLGVKRSLITAGLISTLGAAIRYIATKTEPSSFALVMVGQVIGSAAAPLALNIMTMFASIWFTENLRATAGMFVASNYGAILGMFLIPNIATEAKDVSFTTMIVALMCAATFVPLLFMPAKPPTPPSVASTQPKPAFFAGLKLLAKNYNFWILFLVHGFNVGLSVAFGTIFTQIIAPYGYTDAEAGQMNAVAFFAGTLGCSVAGPVLDTTKQHKLFLRLIAPLVFATDVGFVFIIREDSYAAILFVMIMNQFFLSFLVPTVIELGSETSYPVADATSNSLLWQSAQILGFLMILIMDMLRDTKGTPLNNMRNALIFQAVVAGANMLLAFAFNGRMARSEAIAKEKEHLFQILDEKQVQRQYPQHDNLEHDTDTPITPADDSLGIYPKAGEGSHTLISSM
ncbi:major facilitator superfamily domain-containing protein [Radiomyces spectabilis]|uniref:major facilitator superfamily domain-containing protein n=1 Tax=Radiomyces spectabilis TaxID=64574 RepID=UPI0022207755|nr:major facilitator superfamily domain-containing protein [Radiomyces spectabilis]KAI8373232.1 major facilitator superfamily domain-containing protein [Radiomyces spectabilis]